MENLDRAREHPGSNAGFLLGHHLGSGRPTQSDGSVAAVRHDDVAGDVDVPGSMTALGHEDLFPPRRLNARYGMDRLLSLSG